MQRDANAHSCFRFTPAPRVVLLSHTAGSATNPPHSFINECRGRRIGCSGSRAGPLSANCQHQQNNEEGPAWQRKDSEGCKGSNAGVHFGVHKFHHQRVSGPMGLQQAKNQTVLALFMLPNVWRQSQACGVRNFSLRLNLVNIKPHVHRTPAT